MTVSQTRQPWIYSSFTDGLFILSPPFLSLLVIFLFPSVFSEEREVSVAAWVVLIMLIDVGHVYSTLYRTYFDKETFGKQKSLLINIPLIAWVCGVLLYGIDKMIFWRILAYLAVFHFIRQQYGFMRIYSRKEQQDKYSRYIDTAAIYMATLYPVLFWHFNGPRNFNWFVEGDFLLFNMPVLTMFFFWIYLAIVAAYIIKEILFIIKARSFNIPRNLIIAGTFLSWYFGIIWFNGDLAFTTLNVISHGIPYMALVWIYGKKKYHSSNDKLRAGLFTAYGLLAFLGIVFLFAWLEEGIWDALVWRDRAEVFSFFHFLPQLTDDKLLAFVVPLLALPQITHYVLDGFIWKISKDEYNWKKVTLEG